LENGDLLRKRFYNVKILPFEVKNIEKLKASFDTDQIMAKPLYWSDNDYLRFLS
jgi:hypothetical protein